MSRRRDFIKGISLSGLALMLSEHELLARAAKPSRVKLGLVTYLWGKDWDLPTIIQNCEKTRLGGVELRTEHKHGVEPSLSSAERKAVKKLFADSSVEFIGYGSNAEFDSPDAAILRQNIELAKKLIILTRDVGGSGVKVKPNKFHADVPREKTIEQIGRALNELGKFGAEHGQQIRLEVHGQETQELPNIKAIMDVAGHRNVTICWNCNPEDLTGKGFDHNFNLVKNRLGDTIHIHEMDSDAYPYQDLMNRLVEMDYSGWTLLECHTDPADKVAAIIKQKKIWDSLVATAVK
jgi:sugar phosphate isomerase/epimerase